ncbi:MAG: hypothetical protein WA826_07580 [Silvibacterium sp.]
MVAIDRWRKWRPSDEKFEESHGCEPPKPPKPTFEGFEGSTSGQIQNLSERVLDAPDAWREDFARRPAMPSGVRLGSYAPATPPVKLSQCETVTDTGKFIQSTLRQVDARLHNQNFLAGNWTLSELLARLAACGCRVALDDPLKALQ